MKTNNFIISNTTGILLTMIFLHGYKKMLEYYKKQSHFELAKSSSLIDM